ncbi:MAG: adenylosuccinate synthase [Mariprofundaceae bacterium]
MGMKNTVVAGIQWGDEGKGKIVDLLAPEADVVARFQGGANAGHTLVIGGRKTVLHLVPSGILHAETLCLIGGGTVVAPETLAEEMDMLRAAGVPVEERLRISDRCHLILPWHRALDAAREASRGGGKIGTTGRGIGPAYEDKTARRGIRLVDVASPDLDAKLEENLAWMNFLLTRWYGADPVSRDAVDEVIAIARERLLPLMVDASRLLHERHASGDAMLFEGAQGAMLDVDHGTYPFVTSSNTIAGGALTGLGIGPGMVDEVLGVVKAYTTRVGAGPFPTELYNAEGMDDPAGRHLAERGSEFGATTGRPRRTGWFDAVVVRHAVRVGGVTGLAVTKLDVLDGLDEVKICTGYDCDGERLDGIPADAGRLNRCRPVYESLPGWSVSTHGAVSLDALPAEARQFLARIEACCGCPIRLLSTGPDRAHVVRL